MFPDACALLLFTASAPIVIPAAVSLAAAAVARWLRPWRAAAGPRAAPPSAA